MATANDIKSLPPEFLRAGRFDGLFFVDIPTESERLEILRIMNARYGADIPEDDVQDLRGWTGAEIEQLAKDSLFDGIDEARNNIVPLSKTMKDEIDGLRAWAKGKTRRANQEEPRGNFKKIRRIS